MFLFSHKTKSSWLILALALPSLTYAANWAPENHEDDISCGPLECTAIQACQKTYRGNLPGLGPDNECLGGDCDTYEKVLYSCIDPPAITPQDGGPVYNPAFPVDSPGVPVNIIDPLPVPVDLFNPLPLPVNIVAPTPTPVVVVDDLPMYQQDKLINQALADIQKAQTTGNVTDEIRATLTEAELPVLHPFEPTVSAYEVLLDERTSPFLKMINIFAESPNFNDSIIPMMETYSGIVNTSPEFFAMRPIDYDRLCGGLLGEAGLLGMGCVLEAMDDSNAQPQVMNSVSNTIQEYASMAADLNEKLVDQGEGFYPMTTLSDDPAEENPFLAMITTPGNNVRSIMDKVLEMNIIDAMESEDCWSAIPDNIFDGTMTPMFEEGLFYILQNEGEGEDILAALFELLLGNVYESLSCEVANELAGIFELILGAIMGNTESLGEGNPDDAVITN